MTSERRPVETCASAVARCVRPEILAMQGYVPGEQPLGGKFVKLNTNENPYPPSPKAIAAIEQAMREGLQRYPDPKATSFRLQAAQQLQLDPDWILCGNGSDDLLTIVTRALVGQGGAVRYPSPTYVLYPTLAKLQGATCQELPFQEDWSLPPQFTANLERTRVVFLANPNSPSGTSLPEADVRQLADALPCPLLVDEAYVEFADHHCLRLASEHPRVMVTRTMSKSHGLAGIRFGFLVAHPDWIAQLDKVRDSYNCDRLSVAAATAAMADQAWLAETRAKILATRDRLESGLRELGFQATPSQANFVWCRSPNRPARDTYEQLKKQGVLIRYMSYPEWGDGLRVSVGTDQQIEALLAILQTLA